MAQDLFEDLKVALVSVQSTKDALDKAEAVRKAAEGDYNSAVSTAQAAYDKITEAVGKFVPGRNL